MPKRVSPFERKVARIRELRESAGGQAAARELEGFLADPAPYLAGIAAEAIVALGLGASTPALAAALVRCVRGEQADAGCQASAKIAEALVRLDADEPDAYRAAFGYVRIEPSGPGFVDRAIPVRIQCATGLARCGARGAVLDLTPLLADKEAAVREGVALAIGLLHGDGPAAVLHLKLLAREEQPAVRAACMTGLLAIDPIRYLPIVESELQGDAAELAALALGESRLPAAITVLKTALEAGPDDKLASLLLLALALLRIPEATEILFDTLERGTEALAVHAVHALAVHRHAPEIVTRARGAIEARKISRLDAAFREAFRS